MNQASDRKNKETLWKCKACGYIESQSHLLHCPAYQDLQIGKSLESDKGVAIYFKQVLEMRDKLNI